MKEFVEGLYPLFWIEVLSVMGMVRVGASGLVLPVFGHDIPSGKAEKSAYHAKNGSVQRTGNPSPSPWLAGA